MGLPELIRGDKENPLGRVWVYSKLDLIEKRKELENDLFYFYASDDLNDLKKQIGPFAKKSNLTFDEDIQKQEIERLGFIYKSNIFVTNSEEDILIKKGDIVNAGKFYCVGFQEPIMNNAVNNYFCDYIDKFIKKESIKQREEAVIKGARKMNIDFIDYSSVAKGKMKGYILNNFVNPLLDATRYNEKNTKLQIRDYFLRFGKDSPCFSDVLDIIQIIYAGNGTPNDFDLKLINCRLSKIESVHSEQFEKSAKLRDEIYALEKSSGQLFK